MVTLVKKYDKARKQAMNKTFHEDWQKKRDMQKDAGN